jgi:hypothetical protein
MKRLEPSEPSRRERALLFLAFTALLHLSFGRAALDVLGLTREPLLGFESSLVLERMRSAAEVPPLFPLGEYRSQFGLQGVCLAAAVRAFDLDPDRFAYLAAQGACLLTAAAFAAFFASVAGRMGRTAAWAGALLTALSPTLPAFALSLYWLPPLMFAPFLAAWLAYPACAGSRRREWGLAGGVGLLVAVKALCGYEYISAVVLGPSAAVLYHQLSAVPPGRARLRPHFTLLLGGVAGFALAFGLHLAQHVFLTGDGLAVIRARTEFHATGDPTYDQLERAMPWARLHVLPEWLEGRLPEKVSLPVNCFLHYFLDDAVVGSPGRLGGRVPVWALAALAVGARLWRGGVSGPVRGLAGALPLALAASLSWQVLARAHMCIHFHLNPVVFYLPFLPLASAAAGHLAEAAARRARLDVRGLVPAGCLLLVLYADFARARQAVEGNGARTAAKQSALAALARDGGRGLPTLAGRVESATDVRGQLLWPDPTPLNGSALGLPGAREEVLVLSGWFVYPDDRVPPLSVQLAEGDRLLDADSLVEPAALHAGQPRGAVPFRLGVPRRQVRDMARLRLLVVSGARMDQVREVRPPSPATAEPPPSPAAGG